MAAGARKEEGAQPERCPACGGAIVQPVRGRRRQHCSHACRQVAYRRRRDGDKRRGLVTLLEGDALRFLASIASESVDLVVTDPPYHFQRGTSYFQEWFAELPDEVWPQVLADLYRVLRADRHAYVFCDRRTHPIFTEAARQAGFRVHDPLVWDKDWLGLGTNAWRSSYELILFLEKGRRAGNSRSRRNVLRERRPARGYPTEKPVKLLKTLIGQSSAPGDLILDPFCGSGNVGRAARELGRRAVLCDVNASIAAGRLRLAPVGLRAAAA